MSKYHTKKIISVADKYTSRALFRKEKYHYYLAAHRRGILDEVTAHMTEGRKPRGYWLKKRNCYHAALKCESKTEFARQFAQAYEYALKNDWIAEFTAHMKIKEDGYILQLYVYEFPNLMKAYIGITNNFERRDHEHHQSTKGNDELRIALNSGQICDRKKIKKGPANEIAILEESYRKLYLENGWEVYNKVKGGSWGGARVFWSKNKIIKAAKDYMTKTEFKKNHPGANARARFLNIYEEVTSHMIQGRKENNYYTKDRIYSTASKYKSAKEFKEKDVLTYGAAVDKGLIKQLRIDIWPKGRKSSHYWTKERIKNLALTCNTRTELRNKSYQAYDIIRVNNWWAELAPHLPGRSKK